MGAQVFEEPAGEVAHVDDVRLRQAVEALDEPLRGRADGGGDVVRAGGSGDVDAAMDRVDPGGAGIGHHDARRAEHREPADDAEARVPGAQRQRLAAGDGEGDTHVARPAMRGDDIGHGGADHLARHRVDGRLAGRQRQAGLGDGADARAGPKDDAGARRSRRDAREDERAVRHVRVVARILDDAGLGPALAERLSRKREGRRLAARQGDGDGVGEAAGDEGGHSGLGRGGGAGPRRPAVAQRTVGAADIVLGALHHRYSAASARVARPASP